MKIDLHCHTRKAKSGENIKREVTCRKFIHEVENSQVSIIAITNHNMFDFKQYLEFSKAGNEKEIQVWPGIELDVLGENSEGHCLIISNPLYAQEFSDKCNEIFKSTTPDDFKISIDKLVDTFSNLDILVIAHYGRKAPSLSAQDLEVLKNKFDLNKPLFLEVPNLRSAGILYAHNINSFIGSDVQDWDRYSDYELPELKMPIKDYNHFNLLIRKDEQVLKTFMNTKFNENVTISPFEDCTVTLPIYNDINIFFGGKGTGKSTFLKKLKEHFDQLGNSDVAYYDGQTKETEFKKLTKIKNEISDFEKLNIKDCKEQFDEIIQWKESTITSLNQYVDWAKTKNANKLSASFGFKDISFNEVISYEKYNEYKDDFNTLINIENELSDVKYIEEYVDLETIKLIKKKINEVIVGSKRQLKDEWIKAKALEYEKFTIEKMKAICKAKTGVSQLPSSTGLLSIYINCRDLKRNTDSILKELSKSPKKEKTKIGTIQDKGTIFLLKTIYIDINETNLIYKKDAAYTVSDLRKVFSYLTAINRLSFSQDKNSEISSLITLMQNKKIDSLKDFVGVKGMVVDADEKPYSPSNGEQSMLLLTNSLVDDTKNVYILDEPELSVGHKYINDIIVPRLIDLSKMNKTIIISTHDANIAVRTLPLLSVYREYKGNNRYLTYIGDPFSDILYNSDNQFDTYNWTERSISTLEGGEYAFVERSEIYGK